MTNETNYKETQLADLLADLTKVEAPAMVPLENESEIFKAELTVQTPEETGSEDKVVTEPAV